MVQIARLASDCPAHWVNLALLNDPGLCATDDALGEPAGHCTSFEDEAGGQERAFRRDRTRNDIAGDDMRGVGIWVTQKEGERYNGPRITVQLSTRIRQ
jgi:hypothetical protein